MVHIFTECRGNTGLGHWTRCSALYDAFSESGGDPVVILDMEASRPPPEGYRVTICNWTDLDRLEMLRHAGEWGIAVIDSYLAHPDVYDRIREHSQCLVCIDDLGRIDYPAGSVVLNPGIHGIGPHYGASSRVFAGAQYALLRGPFRAPIPERKASGRVGTLVITMGGNDQGNVTPLLIRVARIVFPGANIRVIVGPFFQNRAQIELSADSLVSLISAPAAEQMFQEMTAADVCVTAGGQTTYELARMGVPMVIVESAGNQQGNIEGFVRAGAAVAAGRPEDVGFAVRLEDSLRRVGSPILRNSMIEQGQRLVDGRGAARFVRELSASALCDRGKSG